MRHTEIDSMALADIPRAVLGAKPDILDVLKKEHREVSGLLEAVTKLELDDPKMRDLADQIETALTIHATIEERIFYPRLRDRAQEQDERVDVFEAFTEHDLVKHLIALLRSRRKRDERFKAELQVLAENVKHHVKEEESTVFSLARKFLDEDERKTLGEKWRKEKEKMNGAAPKRKPSKTA